MNYTKIAARKPTTELTKFGKPFFRNVEENFRSKIVSIKTRSSAPILICVINFFSSLCVRKIAVVQALNEIFDRVGAKHFCTLVAYQGLGKLRDFFDDFCLIRQVIGQG